MSTCSLTRAFERIGLMPGRHIHHGRQRAVGIVVARPLGVVTLTQLLRSAGLVALMAQQLASGVDRPPLMLLAVGGRAVDLFDAARLSNWREADLALQAMTEFSAALPDTFSNHDVLWRLHSRLEDVGDAVSNRQRLQTMDFANGITRLVADLSEEYKPEGPYSLVLLGFYGRELTLGIESGDQARLNRAVADLRQTWNRCEAIVLQRGAVDEARRFTDIVVQLEGAAATSEFVDPTRAELAAVKNLEKIVNP